MKDITNLTVTQIRVFPVDVVPLSHIGTKTCIERIRQDLSVSEIGPVPMIGGPGPIVFLKGEIKQKDKVVDKVVVINRVAVEPRRILLEVVGTSNHANQVYDALLSSMHAAAKIDLETLRAPLLMAETTQCVATLDFNFESLFSAAFMQVLSNRLKKEATSKVARGSVAPVLAEAEISYEIKDASLTQNRITMSPKKFTIAPRAGTPLESRRYLLSSPFDSDTHLEVFRELEEAITKSNRV